MRNNSYEFKKNGMDLNIAEEYAIQYPNQKYQYFNGIVYPLLQ